MTGIDILAMEEVAVEWAFNWMWWWIAVGAFGIGGLIFAIVQVVSANYDWPIIPIATILFAMAGAMFGAVLGAYMRTPTKFETQYKVTISDEVKMADFLERYEIIDTEGKIYTVREKGED